MTREQLEHAIRAACDVAGDKAVYVFGSQAILGEYPAAPAALLVSVEVDLSPVTHPDRCDVVDGALGESSQFHRQYGFYVHGVPIDEAAILPTGWRRRVVGVRNANTRECTGWCVEAHDLAASKLAAYRDKDRDFVRVLLLERLVHGPTLRERLVQLPLSPAAIQRLRDWVAATMP